MGGFCCIYFDCFYFIVVFKMVRGRAAPLQVDHYCGDATGMIPTPPRGSSTVLYCCMLLHCAN